MKRTLMDRIIYKIKSRLTMKRKYCLFIDKVSGSEVFLYEDCYGDQWMCGFNKFGFRVEK